jgi:peptidoglycan/xylan/chitin deacetylase (PgdA/CDA1 family)
LSLAGSGQKLQQSTTFVDGIIYIQMDGVLNFIGRLFWLIVLTMFFGFIGVIGNSLDSASSRPLYAQSKKVPKISDTLELSQLEQTTQELQDELKPAETVLPTPGPSLITTVLGSTDYFAKIKKPFWPHREGIDCAVQKCVALTFDDGPSPYTAALLDILKSKNVVATFFVTGYNIDAHRPELKRMIADKNEIGNHGFGHKNYKKISSPDVTNEVNAVQEAIFATTGYKIHINRPPYGEFRPGEPVLNNTPIIFWNNDPDDWKNRNPAVVEANVMANIKPGSIVVMHDLYSTTVSAVPKLIDDLQAQGYTLVTITELFGWKDPAAPLPNGQLLRAR